MAAAVEVTGLTVELEDGGATIVTDVSLSVARGQILGVVGESGSGKSTLALALLGFTRHGARISAGRVEVAGTDLLSLSPHELRLARRRTVAYVPQDPATALNPALSLRTQLTEGLTGPGVIDRVREILRAVDLPSDDAFLKRKPRHLSGGQQQRVAIAAAIAAKPALIVFDEPTTGLDVSTQARVLEIIRRLCREEEIAAVYVSHDLAVVSDLADRVIVMYSGEIVEDGTSPAVIGRPAHPYTRALLNAVPSAGERHKLLPIRGRAPSVGESHRGCVYAPRCDFAVDACSDIHPPLVAVPSGSEARCIRTDAVLRAPRSAVRDTTARIMPAVSEGVFEVEALNASYSGKQVLFDIDLSVLRGECLALVGESGSGKTTLSRCLIGLHEEQEGTVRFEGEPVPLSARDRSARFRRDIQYVFQNPFGSLNPRATIESSLRAPLGHFFGVRGAEAKRRVAEALERVEIPSQLASRYPADLSGGQRQRVAIARALVCEPKLLICDEVTSALDVSVQAAIVELLRSLLDDGLSMVFVTHDLAVVRSIADSVAVLNSGRVVEAGSTELVLNAPSHEYTQRLMADSVDLPEPLSA